MVRRARLNPLGLDWRRFTVAVDLEDTVIGCVQIKPHRDGSRELASLVVAPDWRHQGIGASLVSAVKAQSGETLWLMCRRPLATYYHRFGFDMVGDPSRMPPYFKRIWRFVQLFATFTRDESSLAIMHWHSS